MTIEFSPQRGYVIVALISVSLLAACATNLTEEQQLALDYERVERQESIRGFVASCERRGQTVVYTGPSYHRLRDPVKHVPSHARLSEYVCADEATIGREFGTGG